GHDPEPGREGRLHRRSHPDEARNRKTPGPGRRQGPQEAAVKKAPLRPVQFFSDEYLERCRAMKPAEVLEFLESFRLLHGRTPSRSRLISLKVPEHLLDAFRGRSEEHTSELQSRF